MSLGVRCPLLHGFSAMYWRLPCWIAASLPTGRSFCNFYPAYDCVFTSTAILHDGYDGSRKILQAKRGELKTLHEGNFCRRGRHGIFLLMIDAPAGGRQVSER